MKYVEDLSDCFNKAFEYSGEDLTEFYGVMVPHDLINDFAFTILFLLIFWFTIDQLYQKYKNKKLIEEIKEEIRNV